MAYYEISPHYDEGYDYCILPADTDADHEFARGCVLRIIESGLDSLAEGENFNLSVKLIRGGMPDIDYGV